MTQSVISNVRYLYDIFIVQKNKEVPIMKKSSSFTKRLIATCIAVAMVVASISTAVFADVEQSGESSYIGFEKKDSGFNVYGRNSSGGRIRTSYNNCYFSIFSVDGNQTSMYDNFEFGKEYTNGEVNANLTASIDSTGKAVIISYNITNNSSADKEVKIGSWTDCKIGDNDYAPISANGNGLFMTDGTNAFYLVPGGGNFTTLWSGYYGEADDNVFTNSETHNYSGDSGLAWSWTVTVPAGGTLTKTARLLASAELCNLSFDPNGGSGDMSTLSLIKDYPAYVPNNAYSRDGYIFQGWSTSADSTEIAYSNGAQITLSEDMTLYAVWALDIQEATVSEEPEGRDLTYNGQPQALAVPGTSDDGTVVYSLSPDGPFTTDVPTATASGTYTVYYKVEGDETHEDSAVNSFEVTVAGLTVTANINGSEVEVNAESTLERPADPTRDGYDFGGWYADEACTTAYNFNAPVGTSGATLYPKWIPIEYTLTEGANGSWTRGGEDGLVFRATRTNNGEATFEHFTGVKVDDNTLGTSNYAATSGSVIVTLTPAYLATLAEGEHTLEIMFNDGSSVTTTFNIAAQVVETTAVETTAAETTATPTETTAAATSGVASTGETQTSSTAPIGIAILMIAGAATMIFIVRKREENS